MTFTEAALQGRAESNRWCTGSGLEVSEYEFLLVLSDEREKL
jgi:hypothetical protein